MVRELLRDVFPGGSPESVSEMKKLLGEELEEDNYDLPSTGWSNVGPSHWENELLRDVFAQNPLTREGSAQALRDRDRGGVGFTPQEELWESEMRDLFSRSPLMGVRYNDASKVGKE